MANLVLRPSGIADPLKAWSLQLRWHGPVETDYHTIARVSRDVAEEIVAAGAAYWLFGDKGKSDETTAEMPVARRIARRTALKMERAELVADQSKSKAMAAEETERAYRISQIDVELREMEEIAR